MNAEPLLPYTVDLFCIEHFDFFHQFIQHPGCQLFCSGVLANQTDKHIRCHGAAALLFDFGAELFDFLGQLLLLVLISPGHSGKAFVRDFAGNIVLIDALKEAVQFFITGKECFQLFLFQLAVGFVRLLGVPDNSLQKVVLIEAGKLGQPPNFAQHHFFQKVYTDVMGGLAGTTVALVVGAVEILDFRVALIEVKVQIAAAVCADKQAGEHIVFSVAGTAFAHLSTLLLYLLKHGTFNNGFVNILEHHPIFRVVMNPLLVLVGLGVGFEVQNITTILLLVQKMGNRGAIPLGGWTNLAPSGTADAFLNPVGLRRQDAFLFKLGGNLFRAKALQRHIKNAPDNLCSFFINDPMLGIVRVLDIPIGRKSHRFAGVAFDFITDTAFLADVAGIPLIEQVSDGCQFVFSLGRVDVVRNGNKSDVMVWEKFFCQPPDLDIVSAQTGKVFDEHSRGFSLFKLLHHFNETGTVHGHAGNAIIQKVNQIGIAFFLCNFGEQFLLVANAVTLALQIIITGKTLIEKSGCFTGFLVTRLFHTRSFLGTVE